MGEHWCIVEGNKIDLKLLWYILVYILIWKILEDESSKIRNNSDENLRSSDEEMLRGRYLLKENWSKGQIKSWKSDIVWDIFLF